jgi:hypothetical protein
VVTKTSFSTKRAKGPQVGRETIAARVRAMLNLSSDREASNVVNTVSGCHRWRNH